MTTITNKEREAARAKILEATFTPLIAAFKDKLKAFIIADHAEKHPLFVEMAANPEQRCYLQAVVKNAPKFQHSSEHYGETRTERLAMKWPSYKTPTKIHDDKWLLSVDGNHWNMPDIEVSDVLLYSSYNATVPQALADEYKSLYTKRQAAQDELNKVLSSYNNREKFEVDFPELAKYLPPRVVASKGTAVAIPVADFKATLLGLGILPSETVA